MLESRSRDPIEGVGLVKLLACYLIRCKASRCMVRLVVEFGNVAHYGRPAVEGRWMIDQECSEGVLDRSNEAFDDAVGLGSVWR